jgi:hypothetical protein
VLVFDLYQVLHDDLMVDYYFDVLFDHFRELSGSHWHQWIKERNVHFPGKKEED